MIPWTKGDNQLKYNALVISITVKLCSIFQLDIYQDGPLGITLTHSVALMT